jgi:phytoene dehydrogenase-like protein
MADATYDAIIVGGGNKGLVVAMYLAKYGGLETLLVEDRHEMGGGWSSEECVPGFVCNTHATYINCDYWGPALTDFPELEDYGLEWIPWDVSMATIFEEDHSSFCLYGKHLDPDQEKSAASLAKFSKRDAETWMRVWKIYKEKIYPAYQEDQFTPPPLPGNPGPLEKAMMDPAVAEALGIDPSWPAKSVIEVMRDLFESDESIAAFLRFFRTIRPYPADTMGTGMEAVVIMGFMNEMGTIRGGTHSLAHATYKTYLQSGGKGITKSEVERVIIENGQAKGVRLVDGTEIRARKMVLSTLDPYSLCFRLIGEENLPARITRRVANLVRRYACITWYGWALQDRPRWKATEMNPDLDRACSVALTSRDVEQRLRRNIALRDAGQMCDQLNLMVWCHTMADPSQAPEGKHVIGTEDFVLPANMLTAEEWRTFKKKHAEDVIREMNAYAPNMTWENVIGYYPITPLDACNAKNYLPEGNWAVIDPLPSQNGSFRPILELAQYRTPIKGLYCTGSAWHPGAGGMFGAGYNCYKIIAEDLDLSKPWLDRAY